MIVAKETSSRSEARFPKHGRCKRSSTPKNQEWSGLNPVDRSVCWTNLSDQVYPEYCAQVRAAVGHEAEVQERQKERSKSVLIRSK